MTSTPNMPRTPDEIIQKAAELSALIPSVKALKLTQAQDLALVLTTHIVRTSQSIVLLTNSQAYIEAHTICRLLFEHVFHLGALLHEEKHYTRLHEHSQGEVGRQMNKLNLSQQTHPTFTEENKQRVNEFLNDPARANDPKTGLNLEQIAVMGNTDCLYTAYKQYSFLYAHTTFASIVRQVKSSEISELHTNVWTVLELTRLLLKTKIINVTSKATT